MVGLNSPRHLTSLNSVEERSTQRWGGGDRGTRKRVGGRGNAQARGLSVPGEEGCNQWRLTSIEVGRVTKNGSKIHEMNGFLLFIGFNSDTEKPSISVGIRIFGNPWFVFACFISRINPHWHYDHASLTTSVWSSAISLVYIESVRQYQPCDF